MLLAAASTVVADQQTVSITSTRDGAAQSAIVYLPDVDESDPIPLVVMLHSWSANYAQKSFLAPVVAACKARRWALVHPDFRGPNRRPEACASDLAVQDVLDAVAWIKKRIRVDPKRIYVVGTSGGGHMALVMAHRAPDLWAGVSAWVPISDLAAWHAQTSRKKLKYAKEMEKVCGGAPGSSAEVDAQFRKRSPLFHLAAAKGLPIDINTGIHDGHTGSVPVSQTLRAFNALVQANGSAKRQVSDEQIRFMVKNRKVPEALATENKAEAGRKRPVLFRRVVGPVRVTIFDGGHEGDMGAALTWLAAQMRSP